MSDFRTIPLTRGLEALVDAADYEALSAFKWYAHHTQAGFYAARKAKGGATVLMHRQVLDAPKGMQVDHVNLCKLDNRRSNIRLCTQQQNRYNTPLRASNRSGFKGVCWNRALGKWKAAICYGGRSHHIGLFTDKVDAARAYDKAAATHHGDFASLNFGGVSQ